MRKILYILREAGWGTGKKSPDAEIGAKHLDYGMMFSGQSENRPYYRGK